ncbi:hypothetical protein cypCar_00004479 [Cyprinus carpio]|nr:hypothetical protein cypCar_00004479 [Cyprinus carpio]
MFASDQTGRPASPHPDLQRTVCGCCAVCKVHLNSSADPRLLPCLHIVCNTCLTKICTDGATQDCPLCAQSFCFSEVTECAIFEDTSNNNKVPKCGGCEESEVSGWCVQCEEALCLDCMSAHRRVKVTRDHEVTPKTPPTGWIQRRRCPSHTQESLRFFCLVCEELTCKDCQLISHRGHRLQDIKSIKVAAKKMLTQVVHTIYQTLVVKATQMLKEMEIETQVKKLLSQKASTPETMIELHIQIQNDLCQHIMKCGVSSTNFTDTDHLESNLPTSLVSEAAPKKPSLDPGCSSGPSNIHQDSLSTTTTTTEKCPSQAQNCQSSNKNYSGPKHWNTGLPTTFQQLVEATSIPVRSKDNLNTTPPADSTPCSTSEDIDGEKTTHDKTVRSTLDYREAKIEDKESAVTLEHFGRQIKQCKRFLRVSLVRLPISLPPSGQPLPEFHLTADTSTDHIFVQESQGGQVNQVWRLYDDQIPSRSSSCSVSQDSDSSLASDVEFCAVCLSAGAALLCAKCGCAFHSDCHIPPILKKPCKDWVCLLCQDVNETVVYGSEEMRTCSLSLQDQRKCEKLVLGLLCNENKSLLYSATKNHSKTAEFDIILGRLLGKRKPPYRTAAELVSDVWTLFDILMMNSERKNMVVKLQKSFQQQLNESFAESLHASLLKQSSSQDPETETEREKHRNTLKRMREFFMANSGTDAKKCCTDKGNEGDGCGNTTAAEH